MGGLVCVCVLSTFASMFVCLVFFFQAVIVDYSHEQCIIHGTHKLHFSVTFSLKMGPTILFTHLKIILLQYFQFSAVSKRTLK